MMEILDMIFCLPEFPNYRIYPNGDVYSMKRKIFLKTRLDKDGYKRISLKSMFTNKLETVYIHSLVAMCYLGYIKHSGLVVDHIDNNKHNNWIHNLQIITQEQNKRKEHFRKIKGDGLPYYIYFTKCGYNVKCISNKEKIKIGQYETLHQALKARNKFFEELMKDVKM
jgi:hypothetical protein